ncbi:hypothetical protein [Microbacterium sp. NIBRBAC000506063]|uniref:hypothetical protein n=1 Tax=Microbacterium sp. NIBRBAC000506063 TaxID=2734618 RepID=UPI001BB6808E|nr:hypothetical protein [Microbacterium sp. NIBRBAC000506063]QTV78938.1 hypothetical protein KAE78_06965 [Microbacterium sp. NIBRBAC000506063]
MAAAIAIVISELLVQTLITAASISAGGAVALAAAANADATATADGSAVGGSVGIGAGVALVLSRVVNQATVPAGLTVSAGSLVVSATVAEQDGDDVSTVTATATSGAGGDVGIAGSVAIAIIDHDTLAAIAGLVQLSGGDVAVTAASAIDATVKALPGTDGATGESFGLGVSFALVILDDETLAHLAGTGRITGAGGVSLAATARTTAATEARMGAAATGDSGVAVTPAIAITLSNVTTRARIDAGADGLITLAGDLALRATQNATATSDAGATAAAGAAAVGVALALTIGQHAATVTLGRSIAAGAG